MIPASGIIRRLKAVPADLALLLFSALLFALAFPNFLYRWGFFPLGFAAMVPAFVVIHRSGWVRVFLYGFLYGFTCYALYNFWLITWHPLAIFIVPTIYAFYFLAFFPVLKAVDTLFPRYGYILQAVAWVGYEYLRTQGFLGYSYGVLGYTQFPFLPLVRVSGLAGIWLVTLMVIFPSAYLGAALRRGWRRSIEFFRAHLVPAALYAVVLAGFVIYGLAAEMDLSGTRKWRVALIQQNIDPWRGGYPAYERSLSTLVRLSREALEHDPEIVIWSETSFVPGIDWHTRYRTSEKSYHLVRRLRQFLDDQSVAYVIGNNDGQKRVLPTGEEIRVDYNATVLYSSGEVVDIYRKTHLVQFSEHFPYRGMWTWLYEALKAADIHWYEAGEEYVVFEDEGVRFSTPICFEDTFGYLGRRFVLEGADVLVNMTNDAWSNSAVCEIQHMTMAVFRAAENRRSVVRSTNGGITCIIDPNGVVTRMIPPFTADYLVGDVPVVTGVTTPYTRWGDWLGVACVFASLAALIGGAAGAVVRRLGSGGIDKQG